METFNDDVKYILLKSNATIANENYKYCLKLFNYFIDMSLTLMSPFFVKKQVFEGKKPCFFNKKWTHVYKIIR